jgi:hypothetical protein
MALIMAVIIHGIGAAIPLSRIDYGEDKIPGIYVVYCFIAGIAILSFFFMSYRLAGQLDTLGPVKND